jgi:hypothetical protein
MNKRVQVTFWALVGVFLIVLSFYLIPVAKESIRGAAFILGAGIVFLILGAALIYFTVKSNVRGRLKKFMLLTGASAAGIPVSVILHNLIYGLFIHFFGENFWERTGMSDEPVFFVLATIICPLAFLIGVVGTAIIMTRR